MPQEKKVSIIMAAFNAEKYIKEAIDSVIAQKHQDWELIIINDGSTDHTESIILRYDDQRIQYHTQSNQGVSNARNIGLKQMTGEYFCFLDADDTFAVCSLSSRMKLFAKNPSLDFVDGQVQYTDINLEPLKKKYTPRFEGNPKRELLLLKDSCHLGQTWLVRRKKNVVYQFEHDMKYSEDVYFYLNICNQIDSNYSFINEVILNYRKGHASAMQNLKGLANGYALFIHKVKHNINCTGIEYWRMKLKIIKVMFLTYLFDGKKPFAALSIIPKYLFA